MDSLDEILEMGLVIISLFTGVSGAFVWYRSSIIKGYAAQRDFEHLKRNYQQLAASTDNLYRFADDTKDELLRELALIRSKLDV